MQYLAHRFDQLDQVGRPVLVGQVGQVDQVDQVGRVGQALGHTLHTVSTRALLYCIARSESENVTY